MTYEALRRRARWLSERLALPVLTASARAEYSEALLDCLQRLRFFEEVDHAGA